MSTESDERGAALSPDGAWVGYCSDRSGQDEVYVQPFPNVEEELIQGMLLMHARTSSDLPASGTTRWLLCGDPARARSRSRPIGVPTVPETEERRPGDPGRRSVLMVFAGPKPSVVLAVRTHWGQLCAGQIVRNALLSDDGVPQRPYALDGGFDRLTSLQVPRACRALNAASARSARCPALHNVAGEIR